MSREDTSEKRYRYWFIYRKPTPEEESLEPDSDVLLYAYTDKKDLFELFCEQRNMKMFRIKKRKISRAMVNFYADNFPHLYLMEKEGKTHETKTTLMDFRLSLTKEEYNHVYSCNQFYLCTLIHREMSKHGIVKSEMLIPDIRYLLYRAQYWNFVDPVYHSELEAKEQKHIRESEQLPDEIPFLDVYPEIDFLTVFVQTYKETLKE